ncbi:MAG: hypothetical protein HXY34_12670 [Candidatus Thorarchaeota archaeon]|nr:hypothetical protein [Candidatus Thorarchaeota archaeon]
MTSTIVGRIIRADISEMSGFKYGTITIDVPNRGRVEFRYDMSSRGDIPPVGSCAAVTYLEADFNRILQIRSSSILGGPSETLTNPSVTEVPDSPVTSVGPDTRRSYPLQGQVLLEERRSHSPRYQSEGPGIVGEYRRPVQEYGADSGPTSLPRPAGVQFLCAIFLLIGLSGLLFTLLVGLFTPLLLPTLRYTFVLLMVALTAVSVTTFAASYGLYMLREWGRLAAIALSALMVFTVIGLVIAVPTIWYLNKNEIRSQFH